MSKKPSYESDLDSFDQHYVLVPIKVNHDRVINNLPPTILLQQSKNGNKQTKNLENKVRILDDFINTELPKIVKNSVKEDQEINQLIK